MKRISIKSMSLLRLNDFCLYYIFWNISFNPIRQQLNHFYIWYYHKLGVLEKLTKTQTWLAEVGSNALIKAAVSEITGGKGQDVFKVRNLVTWWNLFIFISQLRQSYFDKDLPKLTQDDQEINSLQYTIYKIIQ